MRGEERVGLGVQQGSGTGRETVQGAGLRGLDRVGSGHRDILSMHFPARYRTRTQNFEMQ